MDMADDEGALRAAKKRRITQEQDTECNDEDDDEALWEAAGNNDEDEEAEDVAEEAAYRAQEAALAAKYGYIQQHQQQQQNPGGTAAGFTSGRGKALDLPSKEALEKAQNLLQSPTKDDDYSTTAIHDSGFASGVSGSRAVNNNIHGPTSMDTPLHARSNLNRAAQFVNTEARKNGNGITPFKAPGRRAIVIPGTATTPASATTATSNVQHNGKPSLQPLRFGPKGKTTLLQPRMAVSLAEPSIGDDMDIDIPVQHEEDAFANTSKLTKPDAPEDQSTRDANPSLLIHPSSSSSPSRPSAKTNTSREHGLSTGSGKTFILPSEKSIARERSKSTNSAASLEQEHDEETEQQQEHTVESENAAEGSANTPFKPLASTRPNSKKATPSRSSSSSSHTSHTSNISMASISEFGGFTSGAGKPVALPSDEAIEKSMQFFNDSSSQVKGKGKEKEQGEVPITPSRPVLAARNSNIPSSAGQGQAQSQNAVPTIQEVLPPMNTQISFSTPIAAKTLRQPFKAPSRTSLTPSQSHTPVSSSARHLSGIGTGIGGVPSGSQASGFTRLNFEMNQRNTPKTATNRGTFKTPFKNGVKPTAAQMVQSVSKNSNGVGEYRRTEEGAGNGQSPVGKSRNAVQDGGKGKQKIKKEKRKDIICKESVFDLVNRPTKRMDMREYGLRPGYRVSDLIDAGIPKEIIFMTYPKAVNFSFKLGNEYFGVEAAYDELVKFSGCKVSLEWVKNHWGLIVWKLAGIVRAKPSAETVEEHWGFDKVCDQLKYRYEREYIAGQRSCLKRIQEKDSSSTSPVILLVTQILCEDREVPVPLPEGQVIPEGAEPEMIIEKVAIGLELSDGWYKVRTNLDEALYRAIWFGKIFPGMKIAIQGAKTDGSTDGAEPLEAYDSSTLVISGNSTSRAPWHAKLGFVYHSNPLTHQVSSPPFICSFRSLLPDGGLVPFVDVRITRVYNKGYKGEYVEGKPQDLWNEEEERDRQRTWEKEREKALHDIQRAQQTNLMKVVDIRNRLQQALPSRTNPGSSSTKKPKDETLQGCDFTDIYSRLEEDSPSKMGGLIGKLDNELLNDTLEYANRRLESLQNQSGEEARKEIEERCPPRVAKEFVIVRCVDSHAKNTSEGRDCVLSISEPSKLGENLLVEGKRYLLSNTIPIRASSWSSPQAIDGEIFLSTRFDTRFYAL